VRASRDGEILLEVSDSVRESLISSMDNEELVAATETLEADEIAELAPDLPQEVMDDVFKSLPIEEREQLRAAMSFDDDMVGALMGLRGHHRASLTSRSRSCFAICAASTSCRRKRISSSSSIATSGSSRCCRSTS
jgi:hypothetical protein